MPKTVNHLVASVWMLYGLHFDSWFAVSVGLLWTTVYIAEVIMTTFLDFDGRTERLETSAGRLLRDSRGRFADLAPSDYDSPRKA